MRARFTGEEGTRLLIEELKRQRLVAGEHALAVDIAAQGSLREVQPGEEVIRHGDGDNHISFVLCGAFDVILRGRRVAQRGPGNSIGEMAALQASEPRSATVRALEPSLVCTLTEPQWHAIASRHDQVYRRLAQELARRLLEGNNLVSASTGLPSLLIVSSHHGQRVARAIESALEFDPCTVRVWKHGAYLESGHALENFEREIETADFALVIADHPHLLLPAASPRGADSMVLELGLLIGRLGRTRTLLLEPEHQHTAGNGDIPPVTAIPYPGVTASALPAAVLPACQRVREYMEHFGPRN